MSGTHEYTIIGHTRSSIGRWLGLIAIVLAPVVTSGVAIAMQWAHLTGLQAGALTVSTGLMYVGLHWAFNRLVWGWMTPWTKGPDLSGTWEVDGTTYKPEGTPTYHWKATITIVQTWETISVLLETQQSSSYSETASVKLLPGGKTKLTYTYQNTPRQAEPELKKHEGCCMLTFDKDRRTATGDYFNSFGRGTVGRMTLKKVGA